MSRNRKILFAIIAVIIAIMFLFPIYWLVQLSFKPDMEAFGRVLTYYPHTFTFRPWLENLYDPVFMVSLRNSFINAFLTMGITLLLGVPAAYGMGRYKVRGINLFLLVFLVSQMLPASLTLTPLYLIFSRAGLLGTHISSPIARGKDLLLSADATGVQTRSFLADPQCLRQILQKMLTLTDLLFRLDASQHQYQDDKQHYGYYRKNYYQIILYHINKVSFDILCGIIGQG